MLAQTSHTHTLVFWLDRRRRGNSLFSGISVTLRLSLSLALSNDLFTFVTKAIHPYSPHFLSQHYNISMYNTTLTHYYLHIFSSYQTTLFFTIQTYSVDCVLIPIKIFYQH